VAITHWDDSMALGVLEIDQQHKRLISLVNQLHDAMLAGRAGDGLERLLNSLITYTALHFRTEEQYMERYNYPGLAGHKKLHDDLTAKVIDFKERFDRGEAQLTLELMRFLTDWIRRHILEADKRLVPMFARQPAGAAG
jgi:hemerythrin